MCVGVRVWVSENEAWRREKEEVKKKEEIERDTHTHRNYDGR